MKKQIIACAVTAGLAVTAQAQFSDEVSAALGQSLDVTVDAAGDLGGATLNSGRATLDGYIMPSLNATGDVVTGTYEVSIQPSAEAIADELSATGRHIKINYLDNTAKAAVNSVDATGKAGLATYDHVLVPIGNETADLATATGDAVEVVAIATGDFVADVAIATADGAKYSWNQVLVPVAQETADAASATGDLAMEYVLMPTADAAEFLYDGLAQTGNASIIGAAGTLQATGNFSGDLGNASLNAGRRVLGRDAKERRADQRRESEDALKGN